MAVPYVFANATSAIPLSNLDNNFSTPVTIGNVAIQLGNTATTLSNLSLANVTITSSSIAVGSTANAVVYANTTNALVTSSNLTFNGTTFTVANDATINGITVGRGAGAVATNTAVGATALAANTTGGFNTAVGNTTLNTNLTGQQNVAVGHGSLYTNKADYNVAVGVNALNANSTGANNTALGTNALLSNLASNNTAVGYQAGYTNTAGTGITAIGYQALYAHSVTGVSNNTALGYLAGNSVTTGLVNVYLGAESGANHVSGNSCIYIGRLASASSSSVGTETVVGYNLTGKGANTGYYAGSSGVYSGRNLTVWDITSDVRIKKNIVDNTVGLEAINGIRIRNFEYRTKDEITELPSHTAIEKTGVQLGVIAQELQEILPDCVTQQSTGVFSVNTDNITWHLINAIKELSAKVTALEARLGA